MSRRRSRGLILRGCLRNINITMNGQAGEMLNFTVHGRNSCVRISMRRSGSKIHLTMGGKPRI